MLVAQDVSQIILRSDQSTLLLLPLYFKITLVCEHMHTWACAKVGRQLTGGTLLLGPRNQTQVLRFGGKHLQSQSHLTNPPLVFETVFLYSLAWSEAH